MPFVYVQNTKHPNVRFEVVEYDKETKVGKLKGEFGGTFTQPLTKEHLAKNNYKIIESDVALPLCSRPADAAAQTKEVASTSEED